MGGMYVLKAVSTGRFRRLVPFYGMIRVPDDWAGDGQGEPLEHLRAGDATSVLAVIGTADPYTPPDQVERLEAAGVSVAAYEGAEHGFVHDPDRPAHRALDAADAWRRAGEWLWG
jgi:carboxymethylenebutenolidase